MNYQFFLTLNSLIENFCAMKHLYQYVVKETEDYNIMFLYPKMNDNAEKEYFISIEYKKEESAARYDILQYFGDVVLSYKSEIKANIISNINDVKDDIMRCVEDYIKQKK